MCDIVKVIMLDFDFEKLDKVTVAEAIRWAQAATLDDGDEGLKDLNLFVTLSNAPLVTRGSTQVIEGGTEDVFIASQPIRDEGVLPEGHIGIEAGDDENPKKEAGQASVFLGLF